MITVKRILCPIDSSEFSARALRHAAALASWYEALLTALAVRAAQSDWPQEPAGDETIRKFVAGAAAATAADVMVTDGPVVAEILRVAAGLPADLVVMGTHGLTGFERFVLGSVTQKVLRKAPCPVLTVPPGVAPGAVATVTFKKIVCAVDFSPASKRAAEYALSLAQEAEGRLVLVHALEWAAEVEPPLSGRFDLGAYRRAMAHETRTALEKLVPEDARAWCDPEFVIGYGRAWREVLRIADEHGAELIVLGVHGRGVIDRALFGSNAEQVLRGATCPVLTVAA